MGEARPLLGLTANFPSRFAAVLAFSYPPSMKTIMIPCHIKVLWGYLGVQGDFMELSRRELKIPLRVLCLLSYKKRK